MAVRLAQIPSTTATYRMMEQSGTVVPPTQMDGAHTGRSLCPSSGHSEQSDLSTLPLFKAVGAPVPLYQYPAGGAVTSPVYSTSAADQPIVPDMRDNDAWHLGQDLLDLDIPIKAGKIHPTKDSTLSMTRDLSSQSLPSMTVPVYMDATIKDDNDTHWYTHRLSDPFLHIQLPEDGSEDTSSGSTPSGASPMAVSRQPSCDEPMQLAPVSRSTLDTLVTALWEDCDSRGLFRYNVSQCMNRVVPGRWGWVAQLNEGRGSKKRATELKVDAVLQPFDANKFHFGKAYLQEVLLQFQQLPAAPSSQQAWSANPDGARVFESNPMSSDPTLVMINVSPIDYGHILLVPNVLAHRPQQLDNGVVSSALAFVRELANPTFRLGYNSLGAYATINHLHFQGYYLPHELPCEKAVTRPIAGCYHDTLVVSELVDFPVAGWVVEVQDGLDTAACSGDMAAVLMQICGHLQTVDQPFNVLMVDQGRRAFIWPQCYAERQAAGLVSEEMLENGVNPAVFEIAGHLILKRSQDFHNATDAWAEQLLSGVSVPNARFQQLTRQCLQL